MFTRQEILSTVPGSRIEGKKRVKFKGISTDSRTIKAGELFIPLTGQNFDGRKFIPQALHKGASALVVKDGLKALQQLAAYHRSKFMIPVIGVTGSVGKTTTKEMIAAILAQKYPVLKNEENFNNEIGVPLTLLRLKKKHRAAVIEMGMQALGEIALLAKVARPTIAVITNIGEAHLEFLKSKKNIARAKGEIFKYLGKNDFAVINQDDEYFENLRKSVKQKGTKIRTFGLLEKADVTPRSLKGIKLSLPGEHNIYNALAALTVAQILKISKKTAKKALEHFHPISKRMEVINRPDRVKIINDTYNASPQSMTAALKVLAEIKKERGGRTIAVLGDMLELGRHSRQAHRRVLTLTKELKIDKVFTIGEFWPSSEKSKKLLIKKLRKFIRPRDIILVKGSRGLRLEEVADALR